jgi:ankyrin repeat protein
MSAEPIESLTEAPDDKSGELMSAIETDDVARVRELFASNPALKNRINDPLGPFDSPPLNSARSREMMDALLEAGADSNAKSRWWAGGFGVTHSASPELAAYAIERGARVDIHAAARLGLFDRVRELIERDPSLVHARGGDGQTPLHFAKTIEIAAYLLDHGADIDAKDIDHESTPAQYMLGDRPEVARYLVERGCRSDILMASAVGDLDRVRTFLDADPACVRVRGTSKFFPMENIHAGGTIYFWTLGSNASPYQAAAKFGHQDVVQLLLDRSPAQDKLIAYCWFHDESSVSELLATHPGLADTFSDSDRDLVAIAACNNDAEAVRLMLKAGLRVSARGQHGATPLHWAAFHGNLEMAKTILPLNPSLEDAENDFKSTPLQWAIYGSEHGWNRRSGDYAGVVDALLSAGSKLSDAAMGTEVVKNVQRRYGAKG